MRMSEKKQGRMGERIERKERKEEEEWDGDIPRTNGAGSSS